MKEHFDPVQGAADAAVWQLTLAGQRVTFPCTSSHTVLEAMEKLGRKGIPVGCRNGGCGICKVQVLRGRYETARMSRACVSPAEEQQRVALACRTYPREDLELRVIGHLNRVLKADRLAAAAPVSPALPT